MGPRVLISESWYKPFKASPTDHDSTIVEVAPGVLEDQLSAPLVTKENVNDRAF
jgi:ribose transport system substrate-binding protein